MLHNPITLPPPAWPTLNHQSPSHGASPAQRTRPVRWHPYESGSTATSAGMTGLCDKQDASSLKRRLQITIPRPCIVSTRIHSAHRSHANQSHHLICYHHVCHWLCMTRLPYLQSNCQSILPMETRGASLPVCGSTCRFRLSLWV
jgi:hypothetical protein